MASVNKVILIGHLGKDPDVRQLPSGGAVATVTVATNEVRKDKSTGESQERAEWHTVVFFGRLAEIAGAYLRKGRPVYVEGRLQNRKWRDKNGQDRTTTEIIASEMKLLGAREGGSAPMEPPSARTPAAADSPRGTPSPRPVPAPAGARADIDDDDIPFAPYLARAEYLV